MAHDHFVGRLSSAPYARLAQDDEPASPVASEGAGRRSLSHAPSLGDSGPAPARHAAFGPVQRLRQILPAVLGGAPAHAAPLLPVAHGASIEMNRLGQPAAPEPTLTPTAPRSTTERLRSLLPAALGGGEREPVHDLENPETFGECNERESRAHFAVQAGDRSWAKGGKRFASAATKAGLSGGALYGAYKGVDMMTSAPAHGEMGEKKAIGGGDLLKVGLMVPAYEITKNFVLETKAAVTRHAKLTASEALDANHRAYKKRMANVVAKLPDYIRGSTQTIDKIIDNLIARALREERANNDSHIDTERIERLMRWNQRFMIERPHGSAEVEAWKTEAGRERLNAELDDALKYASPADREFGKSLAEAIAANSVRLEGHDRPPPPVQAIFIGAPGTGKDYMVFDVFQEKLKIPVVEIVVPTEKQGGFAELLPKTWDAINQGTFATKDADLLGRIIEALIRAQKENVILYFNEVNARDSDTIDGFKRLLDATKKFIENIPLNTQFDISRVTFVLSLNPGEGQNITDDKAIKSRTLIHRFSNASPELVEMMAQGAFEDHARQLCLPIVGGDGPVLKPDQQRVLRETLAAVLPTLVKEHRDTFEGARLDGPVGMLVREMGRMLRMRQPLTPAYAEGYVQRYYQSLRDEDAGREAVRAQAGSSRAAAAGEG